VISRELQKGTNFQSMFTSPDYAAQIEKLTSRLSELEQENANLRLLDETIRRNTAMFEALVSNSSDGIALAGPDRRMVRVVRTALGYSPMQVIGMPFEAIIHAEDQHILLDCYNQLLDGRSKSVEFEGRFQRPDGSTGWVLAKLTDMLDDPDVQAIVCNYTDVTTRKQRDLMLDEFAAIVESADRAIFSKDLDGLILTWNRGAQKLFGYSSEEVSGRHIWILVPPELQDEEQRCRRQVCEGAQMMEFRTTRVRKDGSRISLLLRLAPVLDRYGRARAISNSSSLLPTP
jgi:PAS domain S-box-containing protein